MRNFRVIFVREFLGSFMHPMNLAILALVILGSGVYWIADRLADPDKKDDGPSKFYIHDTTGRVAMPLKLLLDNVAPEGFLRPKDLPVMSFDYNVVIVEDPQPADLLRISDEIRSGKALAYAETTNELFRPGGSRGLVLRYSDTEPAFEFAAALTLILQTIVETNRMIDRGMGITDITSIKNPVLFDRRGLYHRNEQGDVVEKDDPEIISLRKLVIHVPACVLMALAIIGMTATMAQALSEEKENKIAELLMSCASVNELMWGKFLGLYSAFIADLLVVAVDLALLGSMFARYEIYTSDIFILLGITMIAGVLYGSCAMFLGVVSPNAKVGGMVAVPAVNLVLLPVFMGALILPLRDPGSPWLPVIEWLPFGAPFTAIGPILTGEVESWGVVVLQLSGTLLSGVAVIALTQRIFRRTYLNRESLPGPREILALIRRPD